MWESELLFASQWQLVNSEILWQTGNARLIQKFAVTSNRLIDFHKNSERQLTPRGWLIFSIFEDLAPGGCCELYNADFEWRLNSTQILPGRPCPQFGHLLKIGTDWKWQILSGQNPRFAFLLSSKLVHPCGPDARMSDFLC